MTHSTPPITHPARAAGPTQPRPIVSNVIVPAEPYMIEPPSTNVPSPKRGTRESSPADSPATASTRARTPSRPSTVASVWLGAVLRACRLSADPVTGPARPRNSRAKTISRTSEDNQATGEFAGGQRSERFVGLVEAITARDQLIDLQLAGQVQAHQSWQVLAGPGAAVAAAANHALGRHQRPHVHRHRGPRLRHPDEDARAAGRERLERLAHRARVAHGDERVVGAQAREAADRGHRVLVRGVDGVTGP